MKFNILLYGFTVCVFIVPSTFGSCSYINTCDTSINESAVLSCMDKNTVNFCTVNLSSNCNPFIIPSKYDTLFGTHEYIRMIQSNLQSNDLPVWYSILCHCRARVIIGKSYWSLFNEVLYGSLSDNCKKLLSRNIEELRSKCDIKSAQKLSILTAINTSWKDALLSMRKIVKDKEPLSYDYKLTEALFILHLNPFQPCTTNNSILKDLRELFHKSNNDNEYKDEDVLFYAECITGALACVLKHDKKIPSNFEFDLIQTSDIEWRFMKNVKKLMQAYKDNFIKEQNEMNVINNKNKVYNMLQDEETCKLKQD